MKRKKKFTFVLNYNMNLQILHSDSLDYLALEKIIKDSGEEDGDRIHEAPKINLGDSESGVSLMDIIQKQSRGEWLYWNCTSDDFMIVVSSIALNT